MMKIIFKISLAYFKLNIASVYKIQLYLVFKFILLYDFELRRNLFRKFDFLRNYLHLSLPLAV